MATQRDSARYLNDLHSDFSLLLGANFADPDHPGAHRNERLMFEDNLDHLTARKIEISPQPEAFTGQIEDEAWDSIRVAVQIYDYTGRNLQGLTLRAAAFGDRKCGHSFTP
jgi:hypothetical protein